MPRVPQAASETLSSIRDELSGQQQALAEARRAGAVARAELNQELEASAAAQQRETRTRIQAEGLAAERVQLQQATPRQTDRRTDGRTDTHTHTHTHSNTTPIISHGPSAP